MEYISNGSISINEVNSVLAKWQEGWRSFQCLMDMKETVWTAVLIIKNREKLFPYQCQKMKQFSVHFLL